MHMSHRYCQEQVLRVVAVVCVAQAARIWRCKLALKGLVPAKLRRTSVRQVCVPSDEQTDRQTDRQTHRHTDRQTDRQTNRHTDTQTDT
eukprot:COSAG03_NODE_5350_length_1269_cov_1.297436_1_plen_88_part_10